jgi:hypothetical protein
MMALPLNTKRKLFLLCKIRLEAPLRVNATHDCLDDV